MTDKNIFVTQESCLHHPLAQDGDLEGAMCKQNLRKVFVQKRLCVLLRGQCPLAGEEDRLPGLHLSQSSWTGSKPAFSNLPPPRVGGGRSKSLLPSVPRDQFLSHLSCIEFCLFFVGFIIYILNAWTPRNSDGAVREMREPPPPRSEINRSFQVYFRKKQNERK